MQRINQAAGTLPNAQARRLVNKAKQWKKNYRASQ